MTLLDLLLIWGSAARLTRLTKRDTILEPLRARLYPLILFDPAQRRARAADREIPPPASQRQARLRAGVIDGLQCDWCLGVWWAAVAAVAQRRWGRRAVFQVPAAALTAAYLVGWAAEYTDPGRDQEEDAATN